MASDALPTGRIEAVNDTLVEDLDKLFDRVESEPDESFNVANVTIAGRDFKIRCSSRVVLDRYLRRLAHQPSTAPANAALIDVIAANEIGWPALRWSQPDWQMHIFDQLFETGGFSGPYPYFQDQWLVRRHRTGTTLQYLASMDDLLPWDGGSPLRLPLHWRLLERRRRMLHAATLGLDGRGVLIVGAGGAGKSGTTLAGLASGLSTVGDDYVVIDQVAAPVALPLYRLLKQDAKGLARIEGLPGADGLAERLGTMTPNWQGKYEFDPETAFPGSMTDRLELNAILMPVIAHLPRSRLETVPRAEAVRFMATAMLEQLPAGSSQSVMFFAGLTVQMPVYRLELSENPLEIATTIRDLIERSR